MDFYKIGEKVGGTKKEQSLIIFPNFQVCKTKDLMVRGGVFEAIWDEDRETWSTDEEDVARIIDEDLYSYTKARRKSYEGDIYTKYMKDFDSNMWEEFKKYTRHLFDTSNRLDDKITFINDTPTKEDHVSKKVPYAMAEGPIEAYNELVGTLYDYEEREKFEWAIGSIIAGDSRWIQKFIVFYGEAGSGKSTILNIIQKLFEGYYTTFDAKSLSTPTNQFSTEAFKTNPLVAIQHDGDLSRIEDNTKLHSIISHEEIIINEKYKASYTSRINCFLFMGTNQAVKITDSRSGLLRRLIDISPSGRKVSPEKYEQLISQINFELGGIAYHCLKIYKELGKDYYINYKPVTMMQDTDIFYNFVEENYHIFKNGITLKQAWDMYKAFCDEVLAPFKLQKHKFKSELRAYFGKFDDRYYTGNGDERVRNFYHEFKTEKFRPEKIESESVYEIIDLKEQLSMFDEEYGDRPAQYATEKGAPQIKWDKVRTTLNDILTSKLHYVKLPINHIVIDFDIKDSTGEKNLEKNLKAASKWPRTYTEVSKSGKGLHLHYIYDGNPETLARLYSDGIEIKVFKGNASLRRQLTLCNDSPIAHIASGLPVKGDKMIDFKGVKNEKGIRILIEKSLNKEIHPGTKPNMDFIHKILEDAYNSGIKYDVSDMRHRVLQFAMNSTNQAEYCLSLLPHMKFSSETSLEPIKSDSNELIFFDVEVFPNLFMVCWEKENDDNCVVMINPTGEEIAELMKFNLIGFNCRRYDNHILYGRYLGLDNEAIYNLSQNIINNSPNALYREAYNLSYADVYDFSIKKQSLKKFEVELGIPHEELDIPWDQPVDMSLIDIIGKYCCNDVKATKRVFKERKQDFIARQIISDIAGLTPNDTTQRITAQIIFGDDPRPQDKFNYVDLSEQFPGYVFDAGESVYRGEVTGEGGYVYAEPGMYQNVVLLDIASMHPTSLIEMDMFGPYTDKFKELMDTRLAIKRKEYDTAKKLFDGKLEKYLKDEKDAKALSDALKIVINSVYGLTSARFPNKFKDNRNKDNIVAKRGALFMIDLKHAVQDKGFTVAHIKTDSIKIPNATKEIIEFIFDFGKQYGYTFEHEATYEKLCLLNDSTYVCVDSGDKTPRYKDGKYIGPWHSTGAQLIHPYVFKSLFSKEKIELNDMREIRTVTGALYLDMNEGLDEDEHNYKFIGKAGAFFPIKEGCGGGQLVRKQNDKYYAVSGTKGYRFLEDVIVIENHKEDDIDILYFQELVKNAFEDLSKFGDADWFISEDTKDLDNIPPWCDGSIKPSEKECKGCNSYLEEGECLNKKSNK